MHVCTDMPATRASLLPPPSSRLPLRTLPTRFPMSRIKRYVQTLCYSARIAFKPTGKLPPKPPSLCEHCWKGPFAAQLGLFHPEGYSYFVWRSQVKQGASSGCLWCNFLQDTMTLFESPAQDWPKKPKPQYCKITLTSDYCSDLTTVDARRLEVNISNMYGLYMLCYYLTTSFGEFSIYTQRT